MKLLPDVDCLTEPPLLIWRPWGVQNKRKVNEILALVTEQETKYGRPFDRFTDLSQLDAIDLTFEYVFQVALYRRLARRGEQPIRSGFLVTNAAVAHYVKLHALVTDHSPLKVAMFEKRESAAAWLGVAPALLAET